MKITQGGQAGIAAQFEDAGIEIAKPVTETTKTEVASESEEPAIKREDFSSESAYRTAVWQAQKPQRDKFESDEQYEEAEEKWLFKGQKTEAYARTIAKKTAKIKEAEKLAETEYTGRRQAEERVEALQKELDDLKNAAKAAEQAKGPVRPKRESFDTQEAYEDALLAYGREVDKAESAKKTAAEREEQEKARQAEVVKKAHERIAQARELVEDFDEVIGASALHVPPHIAEYMQESELFAELGYHFAQHPEDLERLAKLPTRTYADVQRLGVAIAKIEGKIKPFSETHKATEKTSTNGTQKTETSEAKPSPTASAPSKRPAPVITPLPTGTSLQTEGAPRTQKEHVEAFGKSAKVDLYARKRH